MIIDTNWALGIVAGALGTLAAVAVIAVLARRRQRPMEYDGKCLKLSSFYKKKNFLLFIL